MKYDKTLMSERAATKWFGDWVRLAKGRIKWVRQNNPGCITITTHGGERFRLTILKLS